MGAGPHGPAPIVLSGTVPAGAAVGSAPPTRRLAG
jgi:hypothetical protein